MTYRILFILIVAGSLFASEKTFTRDVTYHASEYDTQESARSITLVQVRSLLLKETVAFMKAMFDGQKEKRLDEATIVAVIEIKILDENLFNRRYQIKMETKFDPYDIQQKIEMINTNREKLQTLMDIKKRSDNSKAEIKRLKDEIAQSPPGFGKSHLVRSYHKEINMLGAANWFYKGFYTLLNEDWDNALSSFSECIELDLENIACYLNRGAAHIGQGNYPLAIQSFEKVVRLDPYNTHAYTNLGTIYKEQGKNTKAIHAYAKSIKIASGDVDVYINHGRIYTRQKKYSKAIQEYEKAIRIAPNNIMAFRELGYTHKKQRQFSLAIQAYVLYALLIAFMAAGVGLAHLWRPAPGIPRRRVLWATLLITVSR